MCDIYDNFRIVVAKASSARRDDNVTTFRAVDIDIADRALLRYMISASSRGHFNTRNNTPDKTKTAPAGFQFVAKIMVNVCTSFHIVCIISPHYSILNYIQESPSPVLQGNQKKCAAITPLALVPAPKNKSSPSLVDSEPDEPWQKGIYPFIITVNYRCTH